MVGLVDDHDVSAFGDPAEALGKVPSAVQIGMAEYSQVAEVAPSHMR